MFNVFSGTDSSAEVDYDDNYDTDKDQDDGVAWINDGLQVRLETEAHSKDVVCYDFDDNGSYEKCYGCSANDLSNCRSDSSVLDGWCNGDTTCYDDYCNSEITLLDDYIHRHKADVRYYSDCTGTGSYDWWDIDAAYHTVVDRKKTYCHSPGSDHFHILGRYNSSASPWLYHEIEPHNCESWELCDDDHDNVYSETETYDLVGNYNPCRTVEGTGANNQCSDYEDCYNDAACGGARNEIKPTCNFTNGSNDYTQHVKDYRKSCGGSGHLYGETDTGHTCTQYLGSGYVCDSDLDESTYINVSQPDEFCKKAPGESCSLDSDCWNDNGGYDCYGSVCTLIGSCPNNYCNILETASSCPDDCCDKYCSDSYVEGEGNQTGKCFSSCEGYGFGGTCNFYSSETRSACDGQDKDAVVCANADSYVTCCEGTPTACASNKYCSGGSCYTCNTQCNSVCVSSACYGDDPDCDSDGNVNGNCGDGICCQETVASCLQDCGTIDYCNGTIQVITEDSEGNPLGNLSVYVNNTYNISTNIYGYEEISIINVTCGTDYNITVKCENDDVCGSKLSSIDESDDGNDLDPLLFDCSICKGETDFFITKDDIRIRSQGSNANITATVHIENIQDSNLKVNFTLVNKDDTLGESSTYTISSFSKNTNPKASVLLDISNAKSINIYVDPENDFSQDSKTNNFVSVPAIVLDTKAYLDIDTSYSNVNDEIEDYLEKYVDSVPSGQEDVKIYVSLLAYNNLPVLTHDDWLIDHYGMYVRVNGKVKNKPYNGFIASFNNGGDDMIYIIGVDIEGVLAAVKKFVDEKNRFLTNLGADDLIFLGYLDLEAIRVYDYLNNKENNYTTRYERTSSEFKQIARNALEEENYDTSIKLVRTTNTDNVTLRIKHLSSQLTPELRGVTVDDDNPIVLSHGIHSDLTTWEELGIELAKSGRDPWLIEPYGGPGTDTECSPNCPDYNFSDLKTYYWPALIAGIEYYSGKNNISYVGYDLGCTVALESLELYPSGQTDIGWYIPSDTWLQTDLSDDVIDTFVGVACIGNFSRSSSATGGNLPFFAGLIANNSGVYESHPSSFYSCPPFVCYHWYDFYNGHLPGGFYKLHDLLIGYASSAPAQKGYFKIFKIGKNLVKKAGWIIRFLSVFGSLSDVNYPQINTGIISMEVYQDFINWISDPTNVKIGDNVNINNFAIIQSTFDEDKGLITGEIFYLKGSDGFVSDADQKGICQNINSDNKYYVGFKDIPHFSALFKKGMANEPDVKDVVYNFLDDEKIEQSSSYEIISTNQNCE